MSGVLRQRWSDEEVSDKPEMFGVKGGKSEIFRMGFKYDWCYMR